MTMKRWRGLTALVKDAVEHGSRAVERVHMETARRPFAVLEHIPPVAAPARVVHAIHDVTVASVYGSIRLVSGVAFGAVDVVLDAVEKKDRADDA
jgi:hypothetical protein